MRLQDASDDEDQSGPAADTGSLVHAGAAYYHKVRKDRAAALAAMRDACNRFPFGDYDAAEKSLIAYLSDVRNVKAEVVLCEQPIEITLAPAEDDTTAQEIVIQGTLDQIRLENGTLAIWDIKNGKKWDGWEMLHHYAYQLAAYQLGASNSLGKPVTKAGIIRTQDYFKRTTGPVFWQAPWRFSQLGTVLAGVRQVVSLIRQGKVWYTSGDHCSWCPAKGLGNCVPLFDEVFGHGKQTVS